ncbi:Scavenger receptor cysteine-rich type 1 M130 [Paramuricea clavata]|uniref:Scavenger receptor cysteine-rich type 1 M130 n=1 Tax=Paramuricea clavata TaxID=317549 RepID=A0A6S7KGY4_PARCT|nr:Scavenger receptor cysteine-rich type 1 M130 [Paramuricea clavata]
MSDRSRPTRIPTIKNQLLTKTLITDSPPQNSYFKSMTCEGPITILGDSMIKMIKPPKLSRSIGEKVNIKTFPGATINNMNHYIQPTMKKQPKLVILHVGTNDIQRKEPDEIVPKVCQK